MKRGGRLRSDPAKVRAWQDRSRRALPKIGRKARREAPDIASFRAAVKYRAGGWCETPTPACPPGRHEGAHAHHVWPSDRDRGIHDPARGLYVCFAAHRWIHAHTGAAQAHGWLGRST